MNLDLPEEIPDYFIRIYFDSHDYEDFYWMIRNDPDLWFYDDYFIDRAFLIIREEFQRHFDNFALQMNLLPIERPARRNSVG